MFFLQKCAVLLCIKVLLILNIYAQEEYGEDYQYYEGPTDNEYYYGDYGDDYETQDNRPTQISTSTSDPYRNR